MNQNSERQSQVSKEGKIIEETVVNKLEELPNNEVLIVNRCRNCPVKKEPPCTIEYTVKEEKVKEKPDADICVFCKNSKKLVCIISVKKSLRERGAQTAYWALKKKDTNKEFKYILVTTDNDNELVGKRKWRVILPNECDAVFVINKDDSESQKYESEDNFFVGSDHLIKYIQDLLKIC